jgi:N-acetyl-anhydromuramyl-L-alanine amidase AmpD
MVLDEKKYLLSENNYINEETNKTQIVIGHTFNDQMRHFTGWQNRYNGKYKKTAAFTIDAAGLIYKHFDPIFKSNFFELEDLNNKSIVILLENYGWLEKDIEKKEYITWLGDIYNKSTDITEKRWRNNKYWDPYTTEQIDSCLELVSKLCDEFNIPKKVISHNTKIDNFFDYKGVLYKSNLDKNCTDLNPSWVFDIFKEKLEQL